MQIKELLKKEFVQLDGAMGTMLQKKGLGLSERPDLLAITHPEIITAIHREYIESGADIIYSNTFGASGRKLQGCGVTPERVISAAIGAAKAACRGTECRVALDIGPLGELLEPAGTLTFEEAYGEFERQVKAGAQAGADLVVIETMTDLLEAKAALLAVKENCALPVLVTMTFEENGRTFTGCAPRAMAVTLEGLGAHAIGVNCSLGPRQLLPIVQDICRFTRLPVVVKANAGLPDPVSGRYSISPKEFADELSFCVDAGAVILGGCCGTTPEYIAQIGAMLKEKTPLKRDFRPMPVVCTPSRVVRTDGIRVIGERINPTGKKLFKQALLEGNIDYILTQGITQLDAGADILDVNVGLPGIDEAQMLLKVVKRLQAVTDAPLQLDSSDPKALAAALRVYNGKPIVNSVNGEQRVLDAVLPLVKKYGAAVVGLTLDERGIPSLAVERFAIAQRILNAALEHGIPREDVYIDCLTLTASAQQKEVGETIAAVKMVREELGLCTVLGVSNISFGLPERELVNQSFLTLALAAGLNLPIINPNVASMMDAIAAYELLSNRDENAARFIARFSLEKKTAAEQKPAAAKIETAIARGLCEDSRALTAALLLEQDELTVINTRLIPALDEVGRQFEAGKIFLPQLLQAASAAQAAFDLVKEKIAKNGKPAISKGKIVLATVKGDIHDIGKNIVKVILENYGYHIIDLGRDVPPETVVAAVVEQNVALVGLSALMTTTLASMEKTIAALKESAPGCRVFVGGAVLTEEYAKKIGAHYYARDAKGAVDIAKKEL